jgi:autotransporter-associated beta strand protein
MNSHTEDHTPLQPWTDPELEARVVALVLGEASDFEREEIERHLAEQPELRLFKERIEEVHGLLGRREEQKDWRLSEERRSKVLAAISSNSKSPSESKRPWWTNPGFWAAAACLVVSLGIVASMSFPAYSLVSPRSREMQLLTEARQAATLERLDQELAEEKAALRRTQLAQESQESLPVAQTPMSNGAVGNTPASTPGMITLTAGVEHKQQLPQEFSFRLRTKDEPTSPPAPPSSPTLGRISLPSLQIDGDDASSPSEPDFAKSGGGTLTLSGGSNTYTGGTTVSTGVLADNEGATVSIPNPSSGASGGAPGNFSGDARIPPPPPAPAPGARVDGFGLGSRAGGMAAKPAASMARSETPHAELSQAGGEGYDKLGDSLPAGREVDMRDRLAASGPPTPAKRKITINESTPAAEERSSTAAILESITPPPPPVTLETDSTTEPFSTFSLHVSDVSFQLAQAALAKNEWPEKESVRIEEFVNAFDYGDPSPDEAEPVACRIEQAAHPFLQQRNLLRFGVRTASTGRGASSLLRLTLLLDRSGSMERPDRQETVQRALEQLAAEMRDGDELTVIAFSRQPRLVADRANREAAAKLPAELAAIPTEGGTNLEAALALAAEKARATMTPGAQNRIVLLTDGAANLGDAHPDRLAERIHALRQEGIAFDAAGIGADGLNDTILEALTRKGDGRYYLLNGPEDAGEGFARKLAGAFRPGAKDVKVQIQFNPDRVGRYRLLGFEEHRLKKEDFRDDTVDAAELASEEAGVAVYQVEVKLDGSGDVGFVSVRFLDVASGERVERRWLIPFEPKTAAFDQAPPSLQLAGLAAWTAAKLKDDPAAASTDWPFLNRIHAGLPEAWKSASRVRRLGDVLRSAESLASSR